jgi:hypothetical protein
MEKLGRYLFILYFVSPLEAKELADLYLTERGSFRPVPSIGTKG